MDIDEEENTVIEGDLEAVNKTGSCHQTEMKVILLGESCVGKTCLVKRLITKRFLDNTDVTYGAAFAPYKTTVDNEEITMGIWDTAGSERFRSFISTYFRNSKAAIVCYSLDDVRTFEMVGYWAESVREYEENCKIYLCGTKLDLITPTHKSEVTIDVTAEKALAIKASGVYETSSKKGQNVDELFQKVAEDYVLQRNNAGPRKDDPVNVIHLTRNGDCSANEAEQNSSKKCQC